MAASSRGRLVARTTVLLWVVVFIASCALPAVRRVERHVAFFPSSAPTTTEVIDYRGWEALVLGWLEPLGVALSVVDRQPLAEDTHPPAGFGWLANPLALVAAILMLWRRARWWAIGCGTAAAVLVWWCVLAPWPVRYGISEQPLAGAYVWAASLLILAVGCGVSVRLGWLSVATPTEPPEPADMPDFRGV